MGDSVITLHQATEVRLKSWRNVNRPLRPIPREPSRLVREPLAASRRRSSNPDRRRKPLPRCYRRDEDVLRDQQRVLGGEGHRVNEAARDKRVEGRERHTGEGPNSLADIGEPCASRVPPVTAK